jgi:hypothetical protein
MMRVYLSICIPSCTHPVKNNAFDLLDALSRSGEISIDHSDFHVLLPSTHCFTRSLVDTVIVDNVNPIEKVL